MLFIFLIRHVTLFGFRLFLLLYNFSLLRYLSYLNLLQLFVHTLLGLFILMLLHH